MTGWSRRRVPKRRMRSLCLRDPVWPGIPTRPVWFWHEVNPAMMTAVAEDKQAKAPQGVWKLQSAVTWFYVEKMTLLSKLISSSICNCDNIWVRKHAMIALTSATSRQIAMCLKWVEVQSFCTLSVLNSIHQKMSKADSLSPDGNE